MSISKKETMSGIPLESCYHKTNINIQKYEENLIPAGQYPYTRGVHETMYLGKMWTMRMFAGFGSPQDTNKRFHFLLEKGQTGLSTAFDMPTLMGYDPDHDLSCGEVGREGVSVACLDDMRALFDKIPLEQVTTSMTINAPAIVLLAFYIANGQEKGVSPSKLRGTIQNDILKEFIAQKEWICPIRPSMRIIQDMLVYCTKEMPLWNTISISGYHIREAGATAVQELALTLADGIGYIQAGVEVGLDVDEFAPRLSFFFDVHNDFFEEICKFRAARKLWAKIMKERFQAKDPRSWLLRTHAQTAGVSLTAQQPYNNVIRTTIQAMAAVLGGTQSLHTNSLDETYALPTEVAATIALRTQQILAEESGIANVVDPLGGSFFIEELTNKMEEEALRVIEKIDSLGGIVTAIDEGFPQKAIAESAYRDQQKVDRKERIIVGVNRYIESDSESIPTLKIEQKIEQAQIEKIRRLKQKRNQADAALALLNIQNAVQGNDNLVYPIIDAVKKDVTLGEICDVFRKVWGEYKDPAHL